MVRRLQKEAGMPATDLLCGRSIPALARRFAGRAADSAEHLQIALKLSTCYALQAGIAAQHLQANSKDEAAVHRLRGDVLLRIKTDPTAAQDEYRKAMDLRPGDPALLARLAEAQA